MNTTRGGTNESNSVCTRILLDVYLHIPVRHPIHNELGGSGNGAEDGQDVWVCQPFPGHCLLAKDLQVSLAPRARVERDRFKNALQYSSAADPEYGFVYA